VSDLADDLQRRDSSEPAHDAHSGRFIVRGVSDLFDLMGGCCSVRDVQLLWTMLLSEGAVRTEGDHSVIDLPTEADLTARCVRARIAARRERSMLGRYDDLR
jgi:hypothetical protein